MDLAIFRHFILEMCNEGPRKIVCELSINNTKLHNETLISSTFPKRKDIYKCQGYGIFRNEKPKKCNNNNVTSIRML